MKTKYCHSESLDFTSPLTKRTLKLNTSTEFHLLPSKLMFDFKKIQAIGLEFHQCALSGIYPFGHATATDREVDLTLRLSQIKSLDNYAAILDEITGDFDKANPAYPFMETIIQHNNGRDDLIQEPIFNARTAESAFSRMSAVLLRLWSIDQIAIAPKWANLTRQFCETNSLTTGSKISLLKEIESSFDLIDNEQNIKRMSGLLFRLCSNSLGIHTVDDIVPGAIQKEAIPLLGNRSSALLKILRVNQLTRHSESIVPPTPLWHGQWGKRTRGDMNLEWAGPNSYPELSKWRAILINWLPTRPSRGPAIMGAEAFLNYLIKNPNVSRDPALFLNRNYQNPKPLSAWLAEVYGSRRSLFDVNNVFHNFFDWVLLEHLSAQDDNGLPIASPNHWNPLSRMSKKPSAVQTHREAIPTRYIQEMILIITENDWAWSKNLNSDYVPRQDPVTQSWSKIWSPVRATAMLLKLLLPLRSFQVCMLDSGELDEEVFNDGHWVSNPSPLTIKHRRMGALRKFVDRTSGRQHTGFYINTNKTADNGKMSSDKGYEIPWQHQQAIKAISNLIEWQKKNNSLKSPQRWDAIHNAHILRTHPKEALAERGEAAFLFRDPSADFKNDPLTTSRLSKFWANLLKELQNRVAARNETMPDGSPILFTVPTKSKSGASTAYEALYDLHSLRVSLITALATEGGVPIPILSKCIAGHASILMTLYYVKIGAGMITEELAKAQKAIDDNAQENFKRYIFEKDAKTFKPFVLTNDNAGFFALEQKNTHLWSINDKGLCPVGGTLCQIGGPKVTSNQSTGDYAPVPGGARNCIRCRFFVTGPAFLGGLIAHFNSVGIELMEAAERNRHKEMLIEKLEDELLSLGGNDKGLLAKLHMAQDRQEEEMKELDNISNNWHAIYSFIERSKAIISKHQVSGLAAIKQMENHDSMNDDFIANKTSNQLPQDPHEISFVLGGDDKDFEIILEEVSKFETLNSVCQMAVAYPAEKSIPIANLRRSKILDAMLSRNDCKPIFATLSDAEAISVGNQLSSFLLAQLGRTETVNLLEGRRMLEGSGIYEDVQNILNKHSFIGLHANNQSSENNTKNLKNQKIIIIKEEKNDKPR